MKTNQDTLKVLWSILCQSSSIDQTTNNISIYNALEQLTFTKGKEKPPSGPHAVPLQYEYIVLLQRPDSSAKATYPLTLRIRDPKGMVISEAPIPVIFDEGKKRMRVRMQNNTFQISGAGEYLFEALLGEDENPIISTPLEIIIN
jgi:hypothetical protein